MREKTEMNTDFLMNCENEPIQFIHMIQPYCVFVLFDSQTKKIQVVSENLSTLFPDWTAESALNINIESLVGSKFTEEIDRESQDLPTNEYASLDFFPSSTKSPVPVIVHKVEGTPFICIELETQLTPRPKKFTEKALVALQTLAKKKLLSEKKFFEQAADLVRDLTKIDRVMVYKFHEDGHGEVIGESKRSDLEPFLGLHYPESDIPSQARRLYTLNLTRLIYDVNAEPVKLVTHTDFKGPVDMSLSISRHVSEVHLEYLRNMGVRASMSISILLDGQLWGLIACHHYQDSFFCSHSVRSICRVLGDFIASHVSHHKGLLLSEVKSKSSDLVTNMITCVLDESTSPNKVSSVDEAIEKLDQCIEQFGPQLLELMDSCGLRVEIPGWTYQFGEVPEVSTVNEILEKAPSGMVRDSDHLSSLFDPPIEFAGFMSRMIPGFSSPGYLAFFRKEYQTQISWAGKNDKNVVVKNGIRRLTPRGSFELFTEEIKGRSKPWLISHHVIINELIKFFGLALSLILKKSQLQLSSMEQAKKVKDDFLASISHELRTPLNNIIGWLDIYENSELNSHKKQECIEIIRRNAEQELRLTSDLLDLSRISNGKFEMNIGPVDLCSLLREALKSVAPSLMAKEIDVTLELNGHRHLIVQGDVERILQVISNLLTNAIKFSSPKSQIRVEAGIQDQHVHVEIQDKGEGIPPEKISNLFTPFYQTDETRNRVHRGLGLGLHISKSIMDFHKGSISLSSKGLGHGTTATIRLPLSSLEHRKILEDHKTSQNPELSDLFQNKKILLVEDNEDSSRYMEIILKSMGLKVTSVTHAQEALNKIEEGTSFDMILSDISLPQIDGYEFLKKLKDTPLNNIPVLALTAHSSPQDKIKCQEAGFFQHISKPAQRLHLQKILEDALSGK